MAETPPREPLVLEGELHITYDKYDHELAINLGPGQPYYDDIVHAVWKWLDPHPDDKGAWLKYSRVRITVEDLGEESTNMRKKDQPANEAGIEETRVRHD